MKERPQGKDSIYYDTLFSECEIKTRVRELALQIDNDYKGEDSLVLIGVLKGAAYFLSDLSREIQNPNATLDFISVSSYGQGTESTREPIINMDIRSSIRGKNVILVEDIVDTGYNFSVLCKMINARGPKSFKTCSLLSKPERREIEVQIDYLGFEIPNEWVEGYGIDTAESGRTRKDIVARKVSR